MLTEKKGSSKPENDWKQVEELTREIENLLGRGEAGTWTQRDFEFLSQEIFERTGNPISISTLKRLFGRASHTGSPSMFSLNQLAEYLGYGTYNAYKANKTQKNQELSRADEPDDVNHSPSLSNNPSEMLARQPELPAKHFDAVNLPSDPAGYPNLVNPANVEEKATGNSHPAESPNPVFPGLSDENYLKNNRQELNFKLKGRPDKNLIRSVLAFLSGILLMAGLWYLYAHLPETPKKKPTGSIAIEMDTSDSFPKIVSIMYKGDTLPADGANYIDFGNGFLHTIKPDTFGVDYVEGFYSKPGFYKVTVRSNKEVVSRKMLAIPSSGWVAKLGYHQMDFPLPIKYTNSGSVYMEGEKSPFILKDSLARYYTILLNIRDFGVNADRFEFTTRFRVHPYTDANFDQNTMIKLSGTQMPIMVQMATRVPPKGFFVQASEYIMPRFSKEQHLFKRNLEEWQTLSIANQSEKMQIRINGQKVFEHSYKQPLGELSGIEFWFAGSGEVDYVRLKNARLETVFADEFDKNLPKTAAITPVKP